MCHSGSAIDEAKNWARQQEDIFEKGEYVDDEGIKKGGHIIIKYFKDVDCELSLFIKTACTAEEKANDNGEGMGGLFTS